MTPPSSGENASSLGEEVYDKNWSYPQNNDKPRAR